MTNLNSNQSDISDYYTSSFTNVIDIANKLTCSKKSVGHKVVLIETINDNAMVTQISLIEQIERLGCYKTLASGKISTKTRNKKIVDVDVCSFNYQTWPACCAFVLVSNIGLSYGLTNTDRDKQRRVLEAFGEGWKDMIGDGYHKAIFAYADEDIVYQSFVAEAMGFTEIMEPFISIMSSNKIHMVALNFSTIDREKEAIMDHNREGLY